MGGLRSIRPGLRRAASGLLAATLALVLHGAGAQPLPQLQAAAEGSALGVQASVIDAEIALQRLEAARAQQGARAFAGATMGANREPVTDTLNRRYNRLGATAGLRWPLLGGAEAAARAVDDAAFAVAAEPWRQQLVLGELRRELREAYSSHLRAGQRAALLERFAALEAQAQPVLAGRTRGGLLLEADRRAFESMFFTARLELERQHVAQADALAALRLLTRLPLATLEPAEPPESTACLGEAALLQQAARRPAVALAQLGVDSRERQLAQARWTGVEAGVTVQQSLSRDLGGQAGYGTQIGIDLSVPLDWRRWRDSQRSELRLRVRQAQLVLQQRQDEDTVAVQRLLRQQALRETDRGNALQRVDAALEADRVAGLRGTALDGDVFERALKARYELLLNTLAASEARQRLDAARGEVLALGAGAGCAPAAAQSGLPAAWLQAMVASLPLPQPGAVGAAPAANPAPTAAVSAAAPAAEIAWRPAAWFAWRADTAQAAAERRPAAPGERLLLSFSGPEIERLAAEPAAAQALHEQLARVRARGWRVDLLLGDPGFVLPEGRAQLLRLLDTMARFEFDGLNLDLERSQLPPAQQAGWWPATLTTLRAVSHRHTRWPLTLTTHHREFDRGSAGRELRAAGVTAAMPMVYIADVARAATVSARLLAAHPQLKFTVAQSAEPELTAAESSHALGRQVALQRWQALAARLSRHANFAGLAVQSWDTFAEMPP